jgi:hypothetical protein
MMSLLQDRSVIIVGKSHSLQNVLYCQTSLKNIGAGVFGLSTALHLLENEYRKVTIFNHQDFDKSEYSPFRGADSASSGRDKPIPTT